MENKTHFIRTEYCVTALPLFEITHLHEPYNSDIFIAGMDSPTGHEGYGGGPPSAPGYNNYPGQGGPPPA